MLGMTSLWKTSNKAVLALLLGVSWSVSAATPVVEKMQPLKEFSAMPVPPDIMNRIKTSSLAVFSLNNQQSLPNCSAVVISNSGYALTDFHCIYGLNRTTNGDMSNISSRKEFAKARIVAQGKGTYLNFPNSKSPGFNFSKFNEFFDDWALLKLPEREGGYACVPASEPAAEGDSLFHLGFPQEYTMQNSWLKAMLDPEQRSFKDKEVQGLRVKLAKAFQEALNRGENWAIDVAHPMYISLGYNFKTVAAAARKIPQMAMQADLDNVINLNNYGFSSAPLHKGMSGGGVFSIDTGHLIGLNVFTFGDQTRSYLGFPYGVGFVKTSYIREALRKTVGESVIKDAFNCKPSTKTPTHFLASE